MSRRKIRVRATINLPGLRRGQETVADPDAPYVIERIKHGHVIVVENERRRDRRPG